MRVLGVVAGAQAREALPLLVGGAFAAGHRQQQRAAAAAVGRIDFFSRRVCEARKQQQSGATFGLARDRLRVRTSLCGDGRAAWRDALVGLRVMQWVRAQRRLYVHMCARLSFDGFCERASVDA